MPNYRRNPGRVAGVRKGAHTRGPKTMLTLIAAVAAVFMLALSGAFEPNTKLVVLRRGLPHCPRCGQQVSLKAARPRCRACGHDLTAPKTKKSAGRNLLVAALAVIVLLLVMTSLLTSDPLVPLLSQHPDEALPPPSSPGRGRSLAPIAYTSTQPTIADQTLADDPGVQEVVDQTFDEDPGVQRAKRELEHWKKSGNPDHIRSAQRTLDMAIAHARSITASSPGGSNKTRPFGRRPGGH